MHFFRLCVQKCMFCLFLVCWRLKPIKHKITFLYLFWGGFRHHFNLEFCFYLFLAQTCKMLNFHETVKQNKSVTASKDCKNEFFVLVERSIFDIIKTLFPPNFGIVCFNGFVILLLLTTLLYCAKAKPSIRLQWSKLQKQ